MSTSPALNASVIRWIREDDVVATCRALDGHDESSWLIAGRSPELTIAFLWGCDKGRICGAFGHLRTLH